MRYLDTPPVWLAAFLSIAWACARAQPWGLAFDQPWLALPGGLLVGGGLILMTLALIELRKWRTTFLPHDMPRHLVQSGIYKRTRNPIYLGDLMVLLGMVLYWDAPLALPLVPILLWILEKRFVEPEEDRLRRAFRQDYFRYTLKTGRWW